MTMEELYDRISDEHSRVMEEHERDASYTRDEYNFDDGYVSALDWVMSITEV